MTKLYFRTNVLLKNLVGKDLINDDKIAIVELVKNSYDAKSPDVIVSFTNFSKSESTASSQIIITDKGSGMDSLDIKDKWLNIAYSDKKYLEQKKGFYLAGNKGVGRFSCDRLGEQLDLLTRKESNNLLHLQIRWSDFEIENNKELTIQKIPVTLNILDDTQAAELNGGRRFPDHGTTLIISKLRSRWNTDSLKDLKFSLEKFLNPNQLFSCNQFKIFLSVPDIQLSEDDKDYPNRINGEVQNQIFQKLKFNATFIEAKVSDDNKIVSTTLFHEGEKVFELSEHNTSYQMLAGSHVIIYYLNTYKKAYFKRQTGARSVDFGSIFLFLNGFRIAPYGDRGDDWLQLDVRKTQGTQRYLSSRDLVGRIEINGNEQDFTPISSREGLKNTASFKQLKEVLFMDVLRKLEKFVVEGLQWDSVPDYLRHELQDNKGLDWDSTKEQYAESWERKQQRIALSIVSLMGSSREKLIKFWFNPSLLDGIIESRQEEVKDLLTNIDGFEPELIDNKLKKSISQLKKIIEQKEEAAKSAISYATELERETDTYRAQTLFMQQVTSLDVKQLLTFHHQIKLDSTIVNNYITKAINSLKDIPNTKTTIDNLQKALFANKRISAITQYATKANFRAGTKKENTDIPVFFEQYLLNVATDFIATGLKLVVINNVKEPFEVSISRVELSILIDNIISNSAKAQADKLTVTISKSSTNTLLISFLDDGNGLSEQLPNIESMFEMGITTTYGSGLGLYHAKEIIQKNGGKISAKPAQPNGMEIMVEITR